MENVIYTRRVATANQLQNDTGIYYIVTKEVNGYMVWRVDEFLAEVKNQEFDKSCAIDYCRDFADEEILMRKAKNEPYWKNV